MLATGCADGGAESSPEQPTEDAGTVDWGDDNDDENEPWLDAGTAEDAAPIDPGADTGTEPVEEDAGSAPPPPPDGGAPCVRKSYRLRHLQASLEHFDPPAELNSSIDTTFGLNAHTISWTEVETTTQIQRIHARAGWDTFWPSGKPEVVARNAVPISWRSDTFKLVKGNSYFASEGKAGVSPSRWVTRVWLKHIPSGATLSRVAHHSVSGVDGAGKDPVAWRREMHALNIAKFKEVMMLDTVPVIGSADFNTTRLATLLGASFKYDVPSSGGSHGSRLIDWIVRRPHPDHKFVEVDFVSLGASDHRGVRAAYDFTPCE